jgi:two-component system, NarL family, nitrate/nitrite response regulator NarL
MRDSSARTRVVVGDDHPMYREGVVRALTTSGYVDVVAEVGDGRAALTAIRDADPDVALVDMRMPGLDGAQLAHAVRRDGLRCRVLILSAFTDSAVVYRAVREGAAGYLPKESSRAEIVEAVLKCAAGHTVLPPDLAAALVGAIQQEPPDAPRLTERERQVLALIADGKSVPAMARELFLGTATVKTHVQNLYQKLGVSDRGAAVAEAMRRGLLE